MKVLKYLYVYALIIFGGLVSCTPKDVPISLNSSLNTAKSYSGFTGLNETQTLSATKVKLKWDLSNDDKVVGYNIYDATIKFKPTLIKTVAANTSETTLTQLTTQKYYVFRVRATDKNQNEDENMKDLPAIPYGGISPALVQDSTSAIIPFNDGSNADEIDIFCHTLKDLNYTLYKSITDVSQIQTKLVELTAGEVYTCRASLKISDYNDNNTVETTFTPMGSASKIVFSTQPSNAPAGGILANQPVIMVQDINNNVVSTGPDSKAEIKLTVATTSPTGGAISGTATLSMTGGVAKFSGLYFQDAGVKILTATKADTSAQNNGSAALSTDSTSFTISPGDASDAKSTIAITPAVPPNTPLVANGVLSYSVVMTLKDKYGNAVSGIKPTFKSSIAVDTLTQPTLATDKDGVASGSITTTYADTIAPYRTLNFSSPLGLTSSTLAPFIPGAPNKLGFTVQPANPSPAGLGGLNSIKVSIMDAQNNVITSGTGSTYSVTLTIANNTGGATLSGQTTVAAVNGVATFDGLGIDKSQTTSYKLTASSGSLATANSNPFNITSGIPQVISVTAPTTPVISGTCNASPLKIQLKDLGGNLAKVAAGDTKTLNITGLGAANIYSSCSSTTPLSTSITFTSGVDTKSVYIKDLKAELLALSVTDSSGLLTQGILNLNVLPNKIKLAAAGTIGAISTVAGKCSTEIVITPLGDNLTPGPLATATLVTINGLAGTPNAKIYSDMNCTPANQLDPNNLLLKAGVGTSFTTSIWLADQKAEDLSITVDGTLAGLQTVSNQQAIHVLPSNILFTGPSTVVAGTCMATAYTIKLVDKLNNAVAPTADFPLTINGLGTSVNGQFYSAAGCSAASGSNSSLTFPQGQTQFNVYFKDGNSENLSITLSDPSSQLTTSAPLLIGVSPSNFVVTGPTSPSKSSECVGPFTVKTTDTSFNTSAAISPISATLSWTGGDVGLAADLFGFYSDASCTTTITSLSYSPGDFQKNFYFKGLYPSSTPLSLVATDSSNTLQPGNLSWSVTAGPGWIGSSSDAPDADGNLSAWLQTNNNPISTLTADQPEGISSLYFDSTKQYLYATNWKNGNIIKYDYTNHKYIGWIGQWKTNTTVQQGEIKPYGSGVSASAKTMCQSVISPNVNSGQTPSWCVGGQSKSNRYQLNTGNMGSPSGITSSDVNDYIYVTQSSQSMVARYKASSGIFDGWFGLDRNNGCNYKSWSKTGGNEVWGVSSCYANPTTGNYGMLWPWTITSTATNLYVGMSGGVMKYDLAGNFQGWVGRRNDVGATTAGWLIGGERASFRGWKMSSNNATAPNYGYGAIHNARIYIANNVMQVFDSLNVGSAWSSWSGVNKFDLTTGSFQSWTGGLLNTNLPVLGPLGAGSDYETIGQIAPSNDGTVLYAANLDSVSVMDTTTYGILNRIGLGSFGFSDQMFYNVRALAVDANDNILTAGDFVGIKKWDKNGNYLGTIALKNTSPSSWSNDSTKIADGGGLDDNSMNMPTGSYVSNGVLYQTQWGASRIKKIDLKSGKTLGWIGAVSTQNSTCAKADHTTTKWCLGELGVPSFYVQQGWPDFRNSNNYLNSADTWAQNPNYMVRPYGITGDGTYLYVTDYGGGRILKFLISDGSFIGWIGRGGSTTGTIYTAWTTLTTLRTNGATGDGSFSFPSAITYSGGFLYVVDNNNQRVVKVNATTGAFAGWIGKNCNSSTTLSWCATSGTVASGSAAGEFSFQADASYIRPGGITTDDVYLYIANTNNGRIDQWSIATGAFIQATSTNFNDTTGWLAAASINLLPAKINYPNSLWTDGTNIYGTNYGSGATTDPGVWKMNKLTGKMVSTLSNSRSFKLGGFIGSANYGNNDIDGATVTEIPGALSITGDSFFVYVADEGTNRVTRLPK